MIALSRPPLEPGGSVDGGEHRQAEPVEAKPEQREQDRREEDQPDHGRQNAQHRDDAVGQLAPPAKRFRDALVLAGADGADGGCAHVFILGRSSKREMASTMKEMTNRMKPSASSDDSLSAAGLAFRKLQRHQRGDGVAWAEQAGGDAVRVADHEGDRHRLAERAAQPQHDAADDGDARVGNDDGAHHLPGGAADAVGGFLEHRRHRIEHVAHGGGDERNDHDRQDQRCGGDAGAEWRPLEQVAEHRNVAQRVDCPGLHVFRHDRHDDEEAPHAVDDRRNRCQQFDRGAHRTAEPGRRQLRQVKRDAEGNRHRQDQRQHGGDDGAVDRHHRAVVLLHRVPVVGGKKSKAELRECGLGRR